MNAFDSTTDMYREVLLPDKLKSNRQLHWIRSLKHTGTSKEVLSKTAKMTPKQIKFEAEELDVDNCLWKAKIAELKEYNRHLKQLNEEETVCVQSLWRKMKFSHNGLPERHLLLRNLLANSAESEHLSRSLEFQISEVKSQTRKIEKELRSVKEGEKSCLLRELTETQKALKEELVRLTNLTTQYAAQRRKSRKKEFTKVEKENSRLATVLKEDKVTKNKLEDKLLEAKVAVEAVKGELEKKQFHFDKVFEENEMRERILRERTAELKRLECIMAEGKLLEAEYG